MKSMIHINKRNQLKKTLMVIAAFLLIISACKKDDYYIDGGLANAHFNGDMVEYLESKPMEFDSLVQIIKLAGLEETIRKDELTFFAPRDENIKDLIGALDRGGVNSQLYYLGRDTIKTLADVDSAIWRKYLERYLFKGKNLLMDYPQIDFSLLNIYSGQNYYSYNNSVSNIGVVFNDAASSDGSSAIKYMGYRQLHISYISDVSRPTNWVTAKVASSDIQPVNGVVHVLDYTSAGFGFHQNEVENDIINSKR